MIEMEKHNDARPFRALSRCAAYLFFLIGPWLAWTVSAQDYPDWFDDSFRVSSLNPLLIDGSSAVVRLDEQQFDVDGPGKATLFKRQVFTIFEAAGREHGELAIFYDRLFKLKKLEGRLIDANGKVIRKLKRDDQEDYVAPSEGELYADNRVRVANLFHTSFPYTVEFSYQIEFDGLINWPSWTPQSVGLPIELARYDVSVPSGMPVRYRSEGQDLAPQRFGRRGRDVYRWEVSSQGALQQHLLAALSAELALPEDDISVQVAPEAFEIEGARGNMRSWSSFGDWYYGLSEGRDALPESVAREVRQLVAGETSTVDRMRKIYAYFQSKTRYVSVQLGLGGWQPYDAAYVAERGYGDCKALANYLQSLLKEAGVTAYPALIRRGGSAREVLADFPSNQFNHVVLMTPVDGDTLWLEATDQTAPFGHIGTSNEDRHALVVRPGESVLVRTPRTASTRNALVRTGAVTVDETGYATAEIETRYAGNQQDYIRYALVHASERERNEWLHDAIDIPVFEVVNADFSGIVGRQDEVRLPIRLRLARYASQTGKRLFLPTNLLDRETYVPPADPARSKPVRLRYAYLDQTDIAYAIPPGYSIEAMPADVELETTFAHYAARHAYDENGTLRYSRTLEFTTRIIPPERYDDYRAFMAQVVQADRSQVVLVRE